MARRGSWYGGGSAAALSAALAAALLEKLIPVPVTTRQLRRVRRSCLELIQRDALTFARVVEATRARNQRAFRRRLNAAIDVPCRVFEHARSLHRMGHAAQRQIKPQFHSDLRCAMALALAASESARALIDTNLAWLHDPMVTAQTHRRLRAASRAQHH